MLTLYSEPGLRGRHATFKTASLDVERQGFMARSAASTGIWTLCEGAEVASRCQTVDGQVGELRLAPQIVRPGLNALALYDQPGLKGRQVVYSFAADRPAPFHARSARTWGGAWSLCQRAFKHCQTLDGRMANLDLVVEAVRPETDAPDDRTSAIPLEPVASHPARTAHKAPGASDDRTPSALPLEPLASQPSRTAHKAPMAIPVSARPSAKATKARSEVTRSRGPERAPRPPRLVRVDASAPKARRAEPVRSLPMVRTHATHRPSPRPPAVRIRDTHARTVRGPHRGIVIEFAPPPRDRHAEIERRWRPYHPVRVEMIRRRLPRPPLVHHVAERHVRSSHAPRRPAYRRVHMMWGGPDPYLYDVNPRAWGPPPGW